MNTELLCVETTLGYWWYVWLFWFYHVFIIKKVNKKLQLGQPLGSVVGVGCL